MPRAGRNLHENTRLNDVFMLASFYFRSMNSNLYNCTTQWVIHRNALKVLDDSMRDINQTSSHWAPWRTARILLWQSPTYGSSFSSAHRWCSGNPAIAREAHWPQLGGHKGTAWLGSCLVGHLAALCICNCVTECTLIFVPPLRATSPTHRCAVKTKSHVWYTATELWVHYLNKFFWFIGLIRLPCLQQTLHL